MNGAFFHFETVETPIRSVKVRFDKPFASSALGESTEDVLSYFEEFFNRHMAKGYLHFELDLQDIAFPPTRLIALLVALTVRARRRQGEVTLINVSPTARSNFSTFSALNFLAIEHETFSTSKFQGETTPPPSASRLNYGSTRPYKASPSADAKTSPSVATATAAPAHAPVFSVKPGETGPVAIPAKEKKASSPAVAASPHPKATSPSAIVEEEVDSLTEIAEPLVVEQMAEKIAAPPAAPAEKKFQLRVESRTTNLYQLCDFVTTHAFSAGMPEKEIAKIKIAVYEACLNVIEHAYHSRPDEWIDLHVNYSPERFMIIIQDNGISFEMKPPKDYDVNEVIDERRSGGFGLHIIRRAMDSVEYLPDAINGNRLVMVKRLQHELNY
jgi:anti-sigma regulatory factor (Ser/Thr protein kinase)